MKVAVLKGGSSLEREVSLRSGGAGRGRARVARPRGGPARRRRRPGCAGCGASGPTSPSSPCTAPAARTAPCRSCSRSSASPTPGPGVAACVRCMDKVAAKHELRAAGHPDPRLGRLQRHRLPRARRRRHARGDRGAARLPAGGQAGEPGLLARGPSSPPARDEVPEALVAAFSYDDRVLLERYVEGRELAVSVLGRRAAAGRRGDPARGGPLQLRGPLRDRPHRVRLPGRARRRARPPRSQELATRDLRGARLQRLRPRRPDARRRRPPGARGQRDPGPHRHQPASRWRPRPPGSASRSSSAGSSTLALERTDAARATLP